MKSDKGVRLHPKRAEEIGLCAIHPQRGATFPCHNTLKNMSTRRQCAGSMAFAKKHEFPTTLFQLAIRVGYLDPSLIKGSKAVFDSLADMVAVNARFYRLHHPASDE